jgi:pimeloyl-ACP methyl ester carboxylesterase
MPELRVEHDGVTLAATSTPAGTTALVALHGASEGTRASPILRHLHDVLPPAGIGVVTFDRRGEGASTGEPSRGRFEVQASDALAVLDAIDVPHRGLFGYSQGGWVAPLASVRSQVVAFLVVVASAGVTPAQQMRYATERQLRLAGYGDDVVARALGLRRDFEAWVHDPRPAPELEARLAGAHDEEWARLLFLPPRLPDDEGRRQWTLEMDFDPRPVFAQVRVPALALWGEDDAWTPVAPSVSAWEEACGSVETVVVPNAGHDLTRPDGMFAPELHHRLLVWLDEVAHQGEWRT